MKLEELTRAVLQKAFNNFAKFLLKHLCWSLFLIKLQVSWCATLSRRKTLTQVFSCKFYKIFKKTYFVEYVRTDAWVKRTKKIVFTKSIYRKTSVMASFLVQLQTCGLGVFPKRASSQVLLYNCEVWKGLKLCLLWSFKIVKFYRTSFLQNSAARLLLISCDIFNVSLDLSVINQFSHSMKI